MFKNLSGIIIFTLICIASWNTATAQSSEPKKTINQETPQKDIIDLIQDNFKLNLRNDSTLRKGHGPYFSIIPVVGYSIESGVTGAIVTNTSFYSDKSKKRFSNILLNTYYSEYKQYWTTATSSIFLEKQKLHLVGDIRYFNFPTHTFGIGPNTLQSDRLKIKYSYLRLYQSVFHELKKNLFAGIGYNLDYHWNIGIENKPGRTLTDFTEWQRGNESMSSGITLNLLFDSRKNQVNPKEGSFGNIQYRSNMKLLKSDNNWQSLIVEGRHYFKTSAEKQNVIGLWAYGNFTLDGSPPYLDLPSIGWDNYSNTGRGYVPGRFIGKSLVYLESEYRFSITRNGLLGGVLFGNVESVKSNATGQLGKIIPGTGVGIRLKMNKYSSTNIAIDYGFGIGGSRGLFFNLGEVF